MTTTFTRMDESTAEQWAVIGAETLPEPGPGGRARARHAAVAGRHHRRLRHRPAHPLPADGDPGRAGRRRRRGGRRRRCATTSARRSACRTIPRIAAEILKPYVRDEVYEMIRVHQDFQGRHYYHHFGGDPDAREQHRDALDAEEFDARRAVRRRVGPDRVRPRLRHAAARALRAARPRGLRHAPSSL